MTEALLLTGLMGGFIAVLGGALWIIGLATGGPGDEGLLPGDSSEIAPIDGPETPEAHTARP
jgi:hypothetical protein